MNTKNTIDLQDSPSIRTMLDTVKVPVLKLKLRLLMHHYSDRTTLALRYVFGGQTLPYGAQASVIAVNRELGEIFSDSRIMDLRSVNTIRKVLQARMEKKYTTLAPIIEFTINTHAVTVQLDDETTLRLLQDPSRAVKYTTELDYRGKLYRTVPSNGDTYSHQIHQTAWMESVYANIGHWHGIREKAHTDLLVLNGYNHDLPEIAQQFQDVIADDKGIQNSESDESDYLVELMNQSLLPFDEHEKRLVHTTLTHLDPKGTYWKVMEEINYQRDGLQAMSPEIHKYFNRGVGLSVCIIARYVGRFISNQSTTLVLPDLDNVGGSLTIDRKDLIQEHIFYKNNASKIEKLIELGEKHIAMHGDFTDPNAVEGMNTLDIMLTSATVQKLKSDRAQVKDHLKIT